MSAPRRDWTDLCDLITISAKASGDLSSCNNPEKSPEWNRLEAEAQFLANIESYCKDEREQVEMMITAEEAKSDDR